MAWEDTTWACGQDGAVQPTDFVSHPIVTEIRKIVDADAEGYNWGIRVLRPRKRPYKVGEKLKPSYEWIDGHRTRTQLDGTSTIGIDGTSERLLRRAFRDLHNPPGHQYEGDVIALVRGESIGSGNDPGETILNNAEIMAMYPKAEWPLQGSFQSTPA